MASPTTGGPIDVRRAASGDALAMAAVAEAAYSPYVERMGGLRPGPMDTDYAAAVTDTEAWVATDGGAVVGFLLFVAEDDALLLENVAVLPSHRGRGVGRSLLQLAESRTLALGLPLIRLYTHVTMVENQALYERIGFVETARTTEHGFTRVFYEKRLSAAVVPDEDYVATLLAIVTNPAPTGIDPDDPYGQADDGIDRYDGFGRDVRVVSLRVVDGPYGNELEVSFALDLPTDDPSWNGVPTSGSTRVPFDAEWRRLSDLDDPAAYAPQVASSVMRAARDHVMAHQDGGRPARERAERRARTRASLPDREAQRQLLLQTLSGEGDVTQVAADRYEVRLRRDRDDEPSALGGPPETITFVLTPEEWEEVLVDHYHDDLGLHLSEAIADPDPDERFMVFHAGSLRRSTRAGLPPVRGRARERALARMRAERPLGPDDGWFSYAPRRG